MNFVKTIGIHQNPYGFNNEINRKTYSFWSNFIWFWSETIWKL